MNNETKRGRGRPRGSKSFVNVSLEELSDIFSSRQNIPVSRVWLETLGVRVNEEKKKAITIQKQEKEPEEKIKMQLKP